MNVVVYGQQSETVQHYPTVVNPGCVEPHRTVHVHANSEMVSTTVLLILQEERPAFLIFTFLLTLFHRFLSLS